LGVDAMHFRLVPMLLGVRQLGERFVQAPEPGINLTGARFGFGQRRFESWQVKKMPLLPNDGDTASYLGEARLVGRVGPVCPALKKCHPGGPNGWEIISRHDIGQRWL